MIKISITSDERKELGQFRRLSSSKDSEKALMILLCSEGQKVDQIATSLKRNPTVRDWLRRYKESGTKGLSRNYSPGRPDEKRSKIKEHIAAIISGSPVVHGYNDHVWSVPLIVWWTPSSRQIFSQIR